MRLKDNGKGNGEVRLYRMEAPIHAVLSRGVLKGVDCIIHSKILGPVGRYVILKAEIKDKMYLLINIYALITEGKMTEC